MPVYQQIAAIIRERIDAGEITPHRRIPSEKELTDTYGVARATAREAIRLLRDEGHVYTVGQRGTFVAEREG